MASWVMHREYEWVAETDGTQPCAQDPESWQGDARVGDRRAAQLCEGCPFLRECLLEALVNRPMAHGIWGGMTESTRRSMGAENLAFRVAHLRNELELDRYLTKRALSAC